MRISYVRVFVTDLAAAKKFYAQNSGIGDIVGIREQGDRI